MDPLTIALIGGGMSALGNMFGASSAAKNAKKDRAESKRQFDLDYRLKQAMNQREQRGFDRRDRSVTLTSPMRAKLIEQLMASLTGPRPEYSPAAPTTPAPQQQAPIPTGVATSGATPAAGQPDMSRFMQQLAPLFGQRA